MKRNILSIIGLSGVGKSTAIRAIKPILTNWHFSTSEPRSEINNKILGLNKNIQTNDKIKLVQEAYFEENVFLVNNLEKEILELNKHSLILNRGFEDTWVFTQFFAKKGLLDYDYFKEKYFEKLSFYFSNNFIYLYAERDKLSHRINKRNIENGEQQDKTINYADPFLKEMFDFYENWYLSQNNCYVINTNLLQPYEVAEQLLKVITTQLNQNNE